MGIAAIVYHFAIKILGITMMIVEVGYFVILPVAREALVWWRRRAEIRLSPRTLATAGAGIAILLLLLVPWRSAVQAPAVLKSQQHVDIFAPEFGARIASVAAREGGSVAKGTLLVRLASPDVDYRLARARTEIEILEWQLGAKGANSEMLARSQVTEREYESARAEYHALLDQQSRLEIMSPVEGSVVDIADALDPGTWLAAKTRLMSVVDPSAVTVEAYVDEADLERIKVGDRATFFAEADTRIEFPLRLVEIARASTRLLTEPTLASTLGGPIAVRGQKQSELVPDRTIYRVKLEVAGAAVPADRLLRGEVILQGETASLAFRAWRACLAVAIRESGA
jgi:putative peptide zinc metalloprotease protein